MIYYSIPLIVKGDIARNYGNMLGLVGLPSLTPLLLAISILFLAIPYVSIRRDKKT
jgi:hypothetical protein